jgi:hypothetical protein
MRTRDGVEWSATRFLGCGVAETPAEYVVARPTVYLDTTIPSFLTAWPSRDAEKARKQRITHDWWNLYRWQFDVCSSNLVSEEARAGDVIAADLRLEILDAFRKVEVEVSAYELAAKLKKGCGLTQKANADAEHVAVAATHSLKFLLTWNCRHLANDVLRPKMMHICHREGYTCPRIVTPDEIMRLRTHV